MEDFLDGKRRAAILAMDVLGYAHLTETDEVGTLRAVRELRNAIISPALDQNQGRLVKTMGDGFLAEFPEPEAALTAAMRIQAETAAQARQQPPDARILLRIGAHLGDVFVDDQDILGDGVNIAARLEGLCHAGGLAASQAFVDALPQGKTKDLTHDGQHQLKNISRPLTVFRWQAEGISPVPSQPAIRTGPPTLGVMPFQNHSPDPEHAFFAEGLAEDIISGLQQMGRVPVVSGASSLSLNPELSVEDAARVLGAQYLVTGTLRRSGPRVRVTVEYIEGSTGLALWSEKYDRPFEDVFEIQDDITLRVVTALDTELVEGEIDRIRRKRPDHLGAWERYLRGMSGLRKPGLEDLQAAQVEFQAAVALDEDYGDAWAGLGWAYLKEYGFGASERSKDVLAKGVAAAKKGLELANKSPFAHYVMSTAYVWRGEKALSLKELEYAIRLNPFFTRAKLAYFNRSELADPSIGPQAVEEIRKALALSPREPDRGFYFWAIARMYLVTGENIEALDWADRAVNVRPNDPNMLYRRAICLAALDRVDEAQEALTACEDLSEGYVDRMRDWRPYDDDRNDKVFAGLHRNGLAG
ncbi:invasion protein regulator [Ruegeria sp. THAF57]|uniref:adenylate/guanylate cyclase domain-containing protein n=1 Tax=Ruegeria sp. THAF57 TaxID=2744555 RepID=UPI0015DF1B9E|nr:adenylate/guanylate cyclase domain-containing protein [Ruegeria sp. THAF57]CAD0183855.1 invasion protein regulator [Ruegeria sp. THAF57]